MLMIANECECFEDDGCDCDEMCDCDCGCDDCGEVIEVIVCGCGGNCACGASEN